MIADGRNSLVNPGPVQPQPLASGRAAHKEHWSFTERLHDASHQTNQPASGVIARRSPSRPPRKGAYGRRCSELPRPNRVSLGYTEDSVWRNRSEFVTGREQIRQFLTGKVSRELDYRLVKAMWAFTGDHIAREVSYECTTLRENCTVATATSSGIRRAGLG